MELGYWNVKGLAEIIRVMLAYFKREYKKFNPKSTEDAQAQFSKFHFAYPNLPYLVDGDVHITENSAIPIYIAQKAKAEHFFGKPGLEQVHNAETIGVIKDIATAHYQILYSQNPVKLFNSKKDFFLRKFGELSKFLGDKQFFLVKSLILIFC